CSLGATDALAQTQPDRERLEEAARQRERINEAVRRGNEQFPTQLPGTEQVRPFESPRELSTDLPPMTAPQSDAAELLGTAYVPGEDAMFGEQLFQPGVAQVYGVGFNEDYVVAIGDRVILRMWGAFSFQDIQVVDPP